MKLTAERLETFRRSTTVGVEAHGDGVHLWIVDQSLARRIVLTAAQAQEIADALRVGAEEFSRAEISLA